MNHLGENAIPNPAQHLAVPKHIRELMNAEVEVTLFKNCEACGGYEYKTKVKKYIKQELEKNPEKYAFSDVRIPTKDGRLHHFCGDCYYEAITKILGIKKDESPKKKANTRRSKSTNKSKESVVKSKGADKK